MLNESKLLANKFYFKVIKGKHDKLYYKKKLISSSDVILSEKENFYTHFIIPIEFFKSGYGIEVELMYDEKIGYSIEFHIPISANDDLLEPHCCREVMRQLESYFDGFYEYKKTTCIDGVNHLLIHDRSSVVGSKKQSSSFLDL